MLSNEDKAKSVLCPALPSNFLFRRLKRVSGQTNPRIQPKARGSLEHPHDQTNILANLEANFQRLQTQRTSDICIIALHTTMLTIVLNRCRLSTTTTIALFFLTSPMYAVWYVHVRGP